MPLCGCPRRQDDDGNRVSGGEPCERPAGWGTSTPGVGPCRLHGGTLPSVTKAAQEQAALAEARRGLARLGVARPLESVEEALDLLLAVAGQLNALRQGLQDEVEQLQSVRYEHDRSGEQIRGEVTVLVAVTKELTLLLSTIGKLDLEGRRTRLAEAQALVIIRVFERALARLGIDPLDADARGAIEAELAAVQVAS